MENLTGKTIAPECKDSRRDPAGVALRVIARMYQNTPPSLCDIVSRRLLIMVNAVFLLRMILCCVL